MSATNKKSYILLISFLIVVIAASQIIYALNWHTPLLSDDWWFIYEASRMSDVRGVLPFFSFNTTWFVRPMQWLVTYAIFQAWGTNALPYHITSQLLDLLNAVLVATLVFQVLALFTSKKQKTRLLLSVLAATLFLLNWRHHEAIFWYSSVNELLAAIFRLITLNAVAYWIRHGRAYPAIILTSILCAPLAIFSKESAAVLPLETLLLISTAALAHKLPSRFSRKQAILLIGLQVLIIGTWAWFYMGSNSSAGVVMTRGGIQRLATTPIDRILRFAEYLNVNYIGTGLINGSRWTLGAELLLLLLLAIVALRHCRWLWLFALTWTLCSIVPYASTSPPVPADWSMRVFGGDRYLYYSVGSASLFFITSLIWLDEVLGVQFMPTYRVAVGLFIAAIVIGNAYQLIRMGQEWRTAGEIADHVLTQVVQDSPNPSSKDVLCLVNLPDNYAGKYIFRNGVNLALYLYYDANNFTVRTFVNRSQVVPPSDCTVIYEYVNTRRELIRIDY